MKEYPLSIEFNSDADGRDCAYSCGHHDLEQFKKLVMEGAPGYYGSYPFDMEDIEEQVPEHTYWRYGWDWEEGYASRFWCDGPKRGAQPITFMYLVP